MSLRAFAGLLLSMLLLLNWTACSNSSTPMGTGSPTITAQPSSLTVQAGQTATFSVRATGEMPLSYQWQKDGADIGGATAASYTTPPTSGSDDGSQFRVTVSNSSGSITSNTATLTVSSSSSAADVTTYHNDIGRTGQNLAETLLNPGNVNSTTFGKVGFLSVDGKVDAQPLYLSNVNISGVMHNVVYVVTEHASAYAFDATTGSVLWQVSLLGSGETPSDARSCSQVTPEIGITATPVIDRTRGAIYMVAMSKSGSTYFQRLHALDITTGAELFGGPKSIQGSFPGNGAGSAGGMVNFDPKQYEERSGLLLMNGTIYIAWTSHCDIDPYTGWLMAYDASTLAQTSVLNVTPNGSRGAIWMAGGGLAADSSGNFYFLDGNGVFDTTLDGNGFPNKGDYGNGFIQVSTSGGLAVTDYFNMFNTVSESNADEDLGSGAAMVLPDLTDGSGNVQHLAVGAGKDANIYVVNRDNMGKFNSSSNNIYQQLTGQINSVFSGPAYFNSTLYYGSVSDHMKAFSITNARLSSSSTSQSGNTFPYPGATPSISANGTANAILWAVENSNPAVLHAYDATDLSHELYNTNQAGSRDQFGNGNKFITPMIANGRVYVGTQNGVAVFGLLP